MNILLIYRIDISNQAQLGVINKMYAQKRAFEALGHSVELVNHDKEFIYISEKKIKITSNNSFTRYLLNFHSFFTLVEKTIENTHSYDVVYIRYPFITPSFLSFCKTIKKNSINTRVLLELPTFPYNQEFKKASRFYLPIENFLRNRMKNLVDFIIHYGSEKNLFDLQVINSTNGIELEKIPIRKPNNPNSNLRLIAVAKWFYWHGLDRILLGLKEYYKNGKPAVEITLDVVGEGPDLINLKSAVRDLGLEKYVLFKGVLHGNKLNKAFDLADIGVGTLGIHRKGLHYNASLKHREYCARGLPFILATHDNMFPKTCGFVKYFAELDDAINMNALLEFRENLCLENNEIRKYAEMHLDWKPLMRNILDQAFK